MGQILSTPSPLSVEISLDGLHAVTKTSEWKNNGSVLMIKTWEIKTGKELSLIEIPGRATDYLSISHDGRMVIVRDPYMLIDERPLAGLWLVIGVVAGLLWGLRPGILRDKGVPRPNRGIRLSVRNAMLTSIPLWLVTWILSLGWYYLADLPMQPHWASL